MLVAAEGRRSGEELMDVGLFDRVLLADGREGVVLEVEAGGEELLVDIGQGTGSFDCLQVDASEILRILEVHGAP